MKIIIFDTETTGLPKDYKGSIYDSDNWPYIVQLSWIIVEIVSNLWVDGLKSTFIISPGRSS